MAVRRNLLVLLVLTLIMSVSFTGIVQGQGTKNPDTLTVVRFGDPESLDPGYAYDTASSEIILWHVYETLIFFNGSSTGQFVPMLATAVPTVKNGGISKDGKVYTFRVRSGVKFHDGTVMTADDVKYSLLRFMFMDRDGGPSWILLSPILGVDVTRDDKGTLDASLFAKANQAIQVKGDNLSITLQEPFAPFMSIMAMWSMVVNKKWAIAQGDWNGTAAGVARLNNPEKPENTMLFTKANGTGPFKFVQWDRQTRQAILERNTSYWRAPAKIARVIYRVVEDFGPRRLMLQNGDADIISVNRTEQSQVEGLPGVRIIDDLPQLVMAGIFMNLKVDTSGGNPDTGSGRLDGNGVPADLFADLHVRRGVAYAFDYATAVRDCYRNKAIVGRGSIPRGMFGYNPNQQWYTFDRDKAASEFREARGGQVWNTGFTFTVLHNAGNTTRQCLASVLKSGVEGLNAKFKVNVRAVTWSQYLAAYRQGKYPLWIIGWAADFPDADNFVTPFQMSSGTYGKAQSYNSAEVDKLIQQARNETDAAKRRAIYFKLNQLAFSDVPTLYLQPVGFEVMRSWVRGWYFNPAFFGDYIYPMSKQ